MTLFPRLTDRYHGRVTAKTLEQWLQNQASGLSASTGTFSLNSGKAQRLGGYPSLQLSDVALLLLAGAVEGRSSYFRVRGGKNCLFEWDGSTGRSGEAATELLLRENVDHETGAGFVELPEFFWDLLESFYRRCRHAPLNVVVGARLLAPPTTRPKMTPSRQPELILVDRGVAFECPFAFPDRKLVYPLAEPLVGAPWPKRLVFNDGLLKLVAEIARTQT